MLLFRHCVALSLAGLCLSVAAETGQTLQAIRFMHAEMTLLPIVRSHDLVQVFGVSGEAEAVARLRDMIDIIEAPGGDSVDISVVSEDSALAATLTNAVADAGAAWKPAQTERMEIVNGIVAARLREQEDLVEHNRERMLRVMKDLGVIEPAVMSPGAAQRELPVEYQRAKRAYERETPFPPESGPPRKFINLT